MIDFNINNLISQHTREIIFNDLIIFAIASGIYILSILLIDRFLKEKETFFKIIKLIFIWIILAIIIRDSLLEYGINNEALVFKILSMTFTILVGIVSYQIISYIIDVKIKSKNIVKNSSKQTLKLFFKLSIIVITFISAIDVTGIQDILGNTTVFGVIGITLGLTAPIWFPDILSGLILVLNKYINEEDIIEIENKKIYGIVHKIGLFSTVIRNLYNNHMIIIKNSDLRSSTINNLSKKAGSAGLREELFFKIGYTKDNKPITTKEIHAMFNSALKKAKEKFDKEINFDKGTFIKLVNPGDFALEYKIFYFLNNESLKDRIFLQFDLYEIFFDCSIEYNISLSTPILQENIVKFEIPTKKENKNEK